jgi:hypothetical protein
MYYMYHHRDKDEDSETKDLHFHEFVNHKVSKTFNFALVLVGYKQSEEGIDHNGKLDQIVNKPDISTHSTHNPMLNNAAAASSTGVSLAPSASKRKSSIKKKKKSVAGNSNVDKSVTAAGGKRSSTSERDYHMEAKYRPSMAGANDDVPSMTMDDGAEGSTHNPISGAPPLPTSGPPTHLGDIQENDNPYYYAGATVTYSQSGEQLIDGYTQAEWDDYYKDGGDGNAVETTKTDETVETVTSDVATTSTLSAGEESKSATEESTSAVEEATKEEEKKEEIPAVTAEDTTKDAGGGVAVAEDTAKRLSTNEADML